MNNSTTKNSTYSSSRILPLPGHLIEPLKSSITITTLTDVILGLLQNALDAKSTQAVVNVDFARGSCAVEDDGIGIGIEEFYEGGGLGKRFCWALLSFTPGRMF